VDPSSTDQDTENHQTISRPMSSKSKKPSKPKSRNPYALPAKMKKAGPMKDKRAPRGGTSNKQSEYLEEAEETKEE
jgi:hypothetical protein